MKILIAIEPGDMELGWCLMRYIPKVRYLSRKYDRTYIATRREMVPLYEDFAEHLDEYANLGLVKDRMGYQGVKITYIHPCKAICKSEQFPSLNEFGIIKDAWKVYGQLTQFKDNYIVIHPRKKNDGREWNKEYWQKLISRLDVSVYVIGKSEHTFFGFNYSHNYIDVDMKMLISILNSAKLIIGPSSGPMHLASLCGCPQLVWSDNKKWDLGVCKGTNKERYEKHWNPFNTLCKILECGWNPPVELVVNETVKYLKELYK